MKDDTWLIGRRRSDGAKADQKSIGSVSRMAKGKARCRKATGKNQDFDFYLHHFFSFYHLQQLKKVRVQDELYIPL